MWPASELHARSPLPRNRSGAIAALNGNNHSEKGL
jgi:hypothetical protein